MKSLRAPRPRPPADTSHELDETDDQLAELITIWPRLEAALGVDTAGPSATPGGGGGNAGRGSPSPVHLDTQAVMALIDVGVRKLDDQAVELMRMVPAAAKLRTIRAQIETRHHRRAAAKASARRINRIQDADRALTVDEHVTLLEALDTYSRAGFEIAALRDRAADIERGQTVPALLAALRLRYPPLAGRDDPLATSIRTQVGRWRRDARLALNLTEPGRGIGHLCPYHPDQPTELRRDPNEAKLAKAVIAGSRPRSGGSLSWQRSETVRCPHCRRKWAGAIQLRTLMKVIDRTELEAFVSTEVSKAINDEHLHTTLYRCPTCEGVSSTDAWDRAFHRVRADVVDQAEGDRLDAAMICPRCINVVDPTQVDELDGIVVVLP